MPKITIIIPTYNRASLLAQTLDSVVRQSFRDYEAIVIDNASTDDTPNVMGAYLADPRFRYVRKAENQGLNASYQTGREVATGEYVTFLDSDDLMASEKLSVQSAYLDAHPACGVVYSASVFIDADGGRDLGDFFVPLGGQLLKDLVLRRVALPTTGATLIRRDAFERVDGFDKRFSIVPDLDLWIRIAQAGYAFGYTPERLFFYRVHPDSLSNTAARFEAEDELLLQKLYGGDVVADDLLSIKAEAYAAAYYERAARYYRIGQVDHGRARLKQALAASPVLANDVEWQLNWVSVNANSPRTPDSKAYLETVLANLPAEAAILRKNSARARGHYHVAQAFEAFRNRRLSDVWLHVWPGVRGAPSVLHNRGFIAVSIKSLLRLK